MNLELRNLIDQILKAPGRTKLVVLLSCLAVVAAIGISGWVAGRPHFVKLYSELSDGERVAVEKALAGANVRYRVSDFPGPFVVYVDDAQYDQAQVAVALEEALKHSPKGIDSGSSGASTIFMSTGERQQTMQKREWQEAERLLQALDFVAEATVTGSMPDPSPLRKGPGVMVSVALQLKNATTLSNEQAANVAKLVRYRFGVPPENVVITDQSGRTLYDPTLIEDQGKNVRDLLEHAASYDRELAAKANRQIEAAFGPRKALVTVTSQWNYDQSTIVAETVDPDTVPVETETKTTQTPQGASSSVGGAAGVASNSPTEFGNESAAVPRPGSDSGSGPMASTKDERKTFEASKTRTQTVRNTPQLERLSVSLVLDESLAAKREELQQIVEAAVGFDKTRKDVIGVSTTNFAVPEVIEPAAEGGEDVAPSTTAPNPWVELLLERGVEIVSAVAFLFLLVTSLRGGKKKVDSAKPSAATSPGAAAEDQPAEELDPEALARAQIEELVRSDPRRVGEILSRWVDEKSTAKV